MADENGTNGTAGAGAPPLGAVPGADQPRLNVVSQYVKDLSFENPDGPRAMPNRDANSRINVGINVQARRVSQTDMEVSLKFEASAKDNDRTIFATELVYAGVFRFQNIPENQIEPLAMTECARLLFPFARQILADATRNGGFPPLLLDPVDFAAMYRDRLKRGQPGDAPNVPPPANLS
ncbi:MAG: protein-export chaperone SecB [Bauldia sp.]